MPLDTYALVPIRAEMWRPDLVWVSLSLLVGIWLGWEGSATAQVASPLTGSRAQNLQNQPPGVVKEAPPSIQNNVSTAPAPASGPRPPPHFYVREYQVKGGGHLLPPLEIEEAVYPFLGPYRTADDVEQARNALEKIYHDKGYQTVSVQIPAQKVTGGVIVLQVNRGVVGRLRVHGSRYYSIDEIKSEAPSLAEGTTPNFNDVSRDIVNLNQLPDRRITPSLRSGEIPGTVDVDLNVKDSPPLHGSIELNNRNSPDTTPLRLNGSASYDNLFQLGHSIGFSFQVSPENLNEVEVFSGFYLARIPDLSGVAFMLQGTLQNSNVSTLGGIGVAGKGDIVGPRVIFTLPLLTGFYHSLSLGVDYKHFEQDVNLAGDSIKTPVTYFPLSASYSATWTGTGYLTALNASVTAGLPQVGSDETDFDNDRHGASSNFFYFRADLAHTRDLPEGFQLFAKVQGQAADEPLLNSEQFSGGGLDTVRGYLESEALGDEAIFGSGELRTPSLTSLLGKTVDEWRFYAFGDGGVVSINEPLPEQATQTDLASVGFGTRLRLADHYNGSLDFAVPLLTGPTTNAYSPRLTFRLWAEF